MPTDPIAPTTADTDPGPAPTVPPRPAPGTVAPDQWESKYHGLRGSFKQAQDIWLEKEGMLTEQVKALQAQIAGLTEQLSASQGQAQGLQTQVDGIAELQERASLADELEIQVERLSMIMDFPEILAQTSMITVGEGDDQTTERQNPFMDMLMTSTLDGDSFEVMVNQVAEKLRAGQPAATPEPEPTESAPTTTEPTPGSNEPTPGGIVTVGSPPPPAPTGGRTIEVVRDEAMKAQLDGDYETASALWDEHMAMTTAKPSK